MKQLVVNADDLGLSESVNEGIVKSHLRGIVTSTTLMVTMPAVSHAIDCTKQTSLDIGLHLDFTWGTPISSPSEISSLVKANGKFHGKRELMKRLMLFTVNPRHLEKEMLAQIDRFKQTGIQLYHIDVHQHLHGFPMVMKSLVKVACREKIPFIRFVNEMSFQKPIDMIVFVMFLISGMFLPKENRGADHFLGLALTNRLNADTLLPQLTTIQPGITEFMCHPGFDDIDLNHISRLQSREDEIEALISPKVRDYIDSNNITLTTFRDIYRSTQGNNHSVK